MFVAVVKSSCGLNGRISSVKARPRNDFFMLLLRLLRSDILSKDTSVNGNVSVSFRHKKFL